MPFHVQHYDDARTFLDDAEPWLIEDEARNNTPIGVARKCADGFAYGDAPAWFAAVRDDSEIVCAAWRTPPYPMGVTHGPRDAFAALFEHVSEHGLDVPKIRGPLESCRALEALFAEHRGVRAEVEMEQTLFRLDAVELASTSEGAMRVAGEEDTELVVDWAHRFEVEAGLKPATADPRLRLAALDERRLFLWEVDGSPVGMAASTRETPRGASVNAVFTPPDLRGRGYATSLVSVLSQALLDAGKEFCCLYTDRSNPTSNGIYRRIGYREIGAYRTTVFHV